MLAVSAAPSFSWVAKRPHALDKKVLDEAVKAVLSKLQMVEEKRGAVWRFVNKFKLNSQETLLAGELRPYKNSSPGQLRHRASEALASLTQKLLRSPVSTDFEA